MAVTTLQSAPSLPRILATAAVSGRGRSGETLPDEQLRLEAVRVDRDHLVAYERVCGFAVDDALPHTYPHVLGFPLQAALMGGKDFPMPLAGMVHLANRITAHRQLTAVDRLDITVSARDLRAHPKGRLVDLVTEVDLAGERAWEGVSTYLHRGHPDPDASSGGTGPALPDGPAVAVVRLPRDLGRRYAAASGDVNPIHLHPLSARLMGFPQAIAHGMWTYAWTLAWLGRPAYGPATSQVWFRKPVLLPAKVELVLDRQPDRVVAGLRAAKDPTRDHLVLTLAR